MGGRLGPGGSMGGGELGGSMPGSLGCGFWGEFGPGALMSGDLGVVMQQGHASGVPRLDRCQPSSPNSGLLEE